MPIVTVCVCVFILYIFYNENYHRTPKNVAIFPFPLCFVQRFSALTQDCIVLARNNGFQSSFSLLSHSASVVFVLATAIEKESCASIKQQMCIRYEYRINAKIFAC